MGCFCFSKPKPKPKKYLTRADVDRLYPVRPHQIRAQQMQKARRSAARHAPTEKNIGWIPYSDSPYSSE
ncbi:uncharacterized protein FTOL_10455 [Fusarium torulosum]|uniref:Uncharacterized protein n=1 Tax=Fusarium torulosum TaxID=33205 RepID=A0AAE8MHQ2_9HYPO|nr:uncharacterized protein FTOL_10455 [Fusarium torulosum]